MKKNNKGLKSLTEPVIDKLQNYFGIALRSKTSGTVAQMADDIWASFLHVASNADTVKYRPQSDANIKEINLIKTNLFKHGPGLTNVVIALVKPINMDLITAEELKKCLHDKTNNLNESYSALICERALKVGGTEHC